MIEYTVLHTFESNLCVTSMLTLNEAGYSIFSDSKYLVFNVEKHFQYFMEIGKAGCKTEQHI
jgi:hypothetical protein